VSKATNIKDNDKCGNWIDTRVAQNVLQHNFLLLVIYYRIP
jgi:hypothetical protein